MRDRARALSLTRSAPFASGKDDFSESRYDTFMVGPKTTPAQELDDDLVAAAIDAAPYDERPESDEERAAVAEARAEPDGVVPREDVARMLEAWPRPKTA